MEVVSIPENGKVHPEIAEKHGFKGRLPIGRRLFLVQAMFNVSLMRNF
jgi:hypothetical protein